MTKVYRSKNITGIWYPSGGFGHFVNAVLTLRAQGFVRPAVDHYRLSTNGDSHRLPLVAPKFLHNPTDYQFDFDHSPLMYSLLIDNGINNEGTEFVHQFPNANIIKICYSDWSWPVVASAMIHKAMRSTFDVELCVDSAQWHSNEPWAQREKYFLFLYEHACRQKWRASQWCHNIWIEDFFEYHQFEQAIRNTGIMLLGALDLWQQWRTANDTYIKPVTIAEQVLSALASGNHMDLQHCSDVWTQAVINYMICIKYNYVVPANDYADWFSNTEQIAELIKHV